MPPHHIDLYALVEGKNAGNNHAERRRLSLLFKKETNK